MKQRRGQVLVAVYLGASGHQDVLGKPDACEALVSTLHPLDGTVVAVRNDHHEVHVAVIVWLAPGVRTEQPNLLGVKLLGEPPRGFSKQVVADTEIPSPPSAGGHTSIPSSVFSRRSPRYTSTRLTRRGRSAMALSPENSAVENLRWA